MVKGLGFVFVQDTEEIMAKAARGARDSGIWKWGLSGLGALGVLVLGVAAARWWRWRRRCACDDAAGGRSSHEAEPIACVLDGHGIQRRLDEFRQVFERAYIAGEHLEDGVRWRFRATPGLEEELLALADREHRCCRFFRFQIRPTGEEVWWDTRVENRDAQPVLEEFFALPSRMTERDSMPRDVPAFWPGQKSAFSTSDR